MKAHIKNYLSLTKTEWNGMAVMLVVIALVLAMPYAARWWHKDSTINISEFNAALAQLNKANNINPSSGKPQSSRLFKFNPNNLPADKWAALGLSQKQVTTIKNYEAKGGKFYTTADVKKMYSLTEEDYNRMAPYIDLPANKAGYPAKANPIVELNTADSAKLTGVQGIGPGFATRIIYYRERLGGFIAKEQLKEVYGLDELKYKEISRQLRVDAKRIRKVNINTITFDKLRLIPYLNYKQVNAVIEYRKQHGNYASMADLQNNAIIDDVILRKIEPYITF